MRSAGCIVNDISDRKIDKLVERTKNRPIASEKISVFNLRDWKINKWVKGTIKAI